MRVHGKGKRRNLRKFHIGIDADTQEIVAFDLTTNSYGDAETKVGNVLADRAYDGVVFNGSLMMLKRTVKSEDLSPHFELERKLDER